MKKKFHKIFICFFSFSLLLNLNTKIIETANAAIPKEFSAFQLNPLWKTGILSEKVGITDIIVADINNDAKTEIAACSKGYLYTLNHTVNDEYEITAYSDYLGCSALASGDRDKDGVYEFFLAGDDGKVLIVEPHNLTISETIQLPEYVNANDIAVADVDGDNAIEIIVVRPDATFVFDSMSLNLEWLAAGMGGKQVSVGNLDYDPNSEIVVNGDQGWILNASTQSVEWIYARSFGRDLETGDVDGDGLDEIVYTNYINGDYAYVMDGDTQLLKWSLAFSSQLSDLALVDLDKDGTREVILGNRPSLDYINAYRGVDGGFLWSMRNPGAGLNALAAGDTNQDDVIDLVWAAGASSVVPGKNGLFVGNWVTQTVQWISDDIKGPLYVTAGDIDADNQAEIVLASFSSNDEKYGGILQVYEGESYQEKWSKRPGSYLKISHLALGQLDDDPALEVLVAGTTLDWLRLSTHDGVSGAFEWKYPEDDYGAPRAVIIKNIDADAVEEILIATNDYRVKVLNGASNEFQWISDWLGGPVRDMALGDLNGDAILELVVVTNGSLFIFETGSWTLKTQITVTTGYHVAIAGPDTTSPAEILLLRNSNSNSILQGLNSTATTVNWELSYKNLDVKDLITMDVDRDGVIEHILMGSEASKIGEKSLVWVGSRNYPSTWEYKTEELLGGISSVSSADLDSDGQNEFILAGQHLIQVNEMTVSEMYHTYLPSTLNKNCLKAYNYLDNFSNTSSGWPVSDTIYALLQFYYGEYRMFIRQPSYGVGAYRKDKAGNFSAVVDGWQDYSLGGSYGLAFGIASDWSTFYTYEIYPDGWYGIYRYDPDKVVALAQGYSPTIRIRPWSNHLRIERYGAKITAYVNDKPLASVVDGTYTGLRYVGLVGFSSNNASEVDIRFDNFSVYAPACPVGYFETTMPTDDSYQPLQQFDKTYLSGKREVKTTE